jgi:hypothetical protein
MNERAETIRIDTVLRVDGGHPGGETPGAKPRKDDTNDNRQESSKDNEYTHERNVNW